MGITREGVTEVERRSSPADVERILRLLPQWFGIEEAIASYADDAARLPSYLAVRDDRVVGIALVHQHFPESAELHLIAVDPDQHGRGVGRALVEAIERDLAATGTRLLQVHTVGPSREDPNYARTRGFYQRLGFWPVQEFDRIDWDGPTLVLVKPITTPVTGAEGPGPRSGAAAAAGLAVETPGTSRQS